MSQDNRETMQRAIGIVEEMARTMCGGANDDCDRCNAHGGICEFWTEASILYNAGYRKQSEASAASAARAGKGGKTT